MISYSLIITAIALFVGGLVYLVKGWLGSSEDEVVQISDLAELKDLTLSYPEQRPPLRPLLTPEAPTEPAVVPEAAPPVPVVVKHIERAADLERQLHALEERTAAQAAADQENIVNLTHENNKVKRQIEEKEVELSRLAAQVDSVRQSYEHLKAQEDLKTDDWQVKNQALEQHEKENLARIDQLGKELSEAREAASGQQAQGQQLAAERQSLLAEMKGYQEEIKRLEADLELMQKINNQKLNEANEMVRLLQAQKEESSRIQQEVLGKQLSEVSAKVGEFTQERDHLMQARVALEENLEKTRDFNAYLLEKEKVLHYELTKQRAQALGLEKICEDFKIQIDEMAKSGVTNR